MNVKRFTARTSREALRLVREALGDDAVVLSDQAGAEPASRCWRWRPRASRQVEALAARAAAGRSQRSPAPTRAATRRRRRRGARRTVEQDVDAALDEHALVPGLRARSACSSAARRRCDAGRRGRRRAPARRQPRAEPRRAAATALGPAGRDRASTSRPRRRARCVPRAEARRAERGLPAARGDARLPIAAPTLADVADAAAQPLRRDHATCWTSCAR